MQQSNTIETKLGSEHVNVTSEGNTVLTNVDGFVVLENENTPHPLGLFLLDAEGEPVVGDPAEHGWLPVATLGETMDVAITQVIPVADVIQSIPGVEVVDDC